MAKTTSASGSQIFADANILSNKVSPEFMALVASSSVGIDFERCMIIKIREEETAADGI